MLVHLSQKCIQENLQIVRACPLLENLSTSTQVQKRGSDDTNNSRCTRQTETATNQFTCSLLGWYNANHRATTTPSKNLARTNDTGPVCVFRVCVCIPAHECLLDEILRLDLLDLGIFPAVCSVVRVGLTQFLSVMLAVLWTDLAVEVSLCRVVVITQLDRIRHWLTWQKHAVKTNTGFDFRLGEVHFSRVAMESVTTGLFLCDDV